MTTWADKFIPKHKPDGTPWDNLVNDHYNTPEDVGGVCVYIGRFQPFHNGHLETLRFALKWYSKVILLIGRKHWGEKSNKENPFKNENIRTMILNSLNPFYLDKLYIEDIWDVPSTNEWIYDVINIVRKINTEKHSVSIIGCKEKAYYITLFPKFNVIDRPLHNTIHGTDIRKKFFTLNSQNADQYWQYIWNSVPQGTYLELIKFYATKEYFEIAKLYKGDM